MCGIAGICSAEKLSPEGTLLWMQRAITHRGPDDCGAQRIDARRISLAHTRLSILDLSEAGHQPMQDRETGNWVVFNGEIYNYQTLREELGVRSEGWGKKTGDGRTETGDWQGAGSSEQGAQTGECWISDFGFRNTADRKSHVERGQSSVVGPQSSVSECPWHSNSDTEVILRAYAKWGKDCVTHFRGMFAFAIWDEQKKEMFLARDPFGIKPLYFYETADTFLFASELRALLASELVPRRLSRAGLASYLQFGSAQDPLTILDNVHSLLAGHGLVVKPTSNRIETKDVCFPSPLTPEAHAPYVSRLTPHASANRKEAVTQLRTILEESVRAHLVSDVPVAAFLSGGIDSSAIVALMTQVSDVRPKTFSVTFEESDLSEAEYSQLIATKFGTEHHEILLSETRLMEMLIGAFQAIDSPTMDGINTYVVSKAVHDAGVKVALSGLGGDELFAGYPSFRRALQMQKLSNLPSAIRSAASSIGHVALNGSARNRKFWDIVASDCSPYAAYSLSRQLFSPSEIASLLSVPVRSKESGGRGPGPESRGQKSEVRGQFDPGQPSSVPGRHSDPINEVSFYELSGYMTNTLLRDTDQMSMAHALEVRVPFVDPEVVNYVMGLPGDWKVDGNRPKPLLIDALDNLLPEEIWKRRKMGFTLPFQRWMQAGLKSSVGQVFSDRAGLDQVGLSSSETSSIWETFKNNSQQEPWSRPWALYLLKQWCDLNGVSV